MQSVVIELLTNDDRIYKPKYMDESSATSVAKTAEREREKKKKAEAAANDSNKDSSKDVKSRSRARSIWGRKKSAAA